MKKRLAFLGLLLVLALGGAAWLFLSRESPAERPAGPFPATTGATSRPDAATPSRAWAVRLDRPGLPNLHRVSDTLFRGAQPEENGFAELEKMGIRTVVNLRSAHSDREMLAGTRLLYVEIPITASKVTGEAVVYFLRIAGDPARAPVFVHCQHGADRTGVMCAFYRVVLQDWSREEAIDEMTGGGFGFHSIYLSTLVPMVRAADPARLRRLSGSVLRTAPAAGQPLEAEAP